MKTKLVPLAIVTFLLAGTFLISLQGTSRAEPPTVVQLDLATTIAAQPIGPEFTVDSSVDDPDADPGDGLCMTASGLCSLRAAIQESNAEPGLNVVILPSGTYTLTIPDDGTGEEEAAAGDLDITEDLDLQGAGATTTIIDGGELDRVIHAMGAASVNIEGVTIQNGIGGGIWVGSPFGPTLLTLSDSILRDNQAWRGGGLGVNTGAEARLNRVLITGNRASDGGGGVYLSGNDGTFMGGARATFVNVTLSGNSALGGGAILTHGQLTLINSTVAENTSEGEMGGALMAVASLASGTLEQAETYVQNTIVANNEGGNCVDFSYGWPLRNIQSWGSNLDSGDTCGFSSANDLTEAAPLLEPLADNGGETSTHALLPFSPAIDAASDDSCPTVDQRGMVRPQDGDGDGAARCDMGAFEAPTPPCPIAPYDFNDDLSVDIVDVGMVASRWGNPEFYELAFDLAPLGSPDGVIDIADIAAVAVHFGETCR